MGMGPTFAVQTKAALVLELLEAFAANARMLADAEQEERISFDDRIIQTSLAIVSELTRQASTMPLERLAEFVRHLREDGPQICEWMIQEVSSKSPPVMSSHYLRLHFVKPPEA